MSLLPSDPEGVVPLMQLINEIEATLGLQPEVFELPMSRPCWGYAASDKNDSTVVVVSYWSGVATCGTLFLRGSGNRLKVPNIGWDPITGRAWASDPAAARRELILWISERVHLRLRSRHV